MYSTACQSCGTMFEARRYGAKTCSDKCRKRLSRAGSSVPAASLQVVHGDPVSMVSEPLTVTESLDSPLADQLHAIRLVLARALDSEKTPPSSLAALARCFMEVTAERESLVVREHEESRPDLKVVDMDWDPDDI